MAKAVTIEYLDRPTGRRCREQVYAGGFLRWLYNTLTGKVASHLLFRHALASRLYGFWSSLPFSRCQIKTLVGSGEVNREDFNQPTSDFNSFNDFFTRRIDLSRRPIPNDPAICISPVDGKALALASIDSRETFQIKRHSFNLSSFLADPDLIRRFDGGSMIICRLSLADYHHFHFPDSGWAGESRQIPGDLQASGPYSERTLVPYYTQNQRTLTPILADHFRFMLMVEIGALTVGSIVQCYQAGHAVRRGQEKGHFALGGSTVVLLFQPGTIRIDNDLLRNTAAGLETQVRVGDSLGRATCLQSYSEILEESIQ